MSERDIVAWRDHVLELVQCEFDTWTAVSTEVVVWEHKLPKSERGIIDTVLMGTAVVLLDAKGGKEPDPCIGILTTSEDREPSGVSLEGYDVVVVDREAADALGRALTALKEAR